VDPRLLGRLLVLIDAYGPDIVQVNGGRTVKYGAFCAFLRPRRRWALVYRNIGEPDRWVRGALRRFYYRRLIIPAVDGVVGVSQATLEGVQRFYGLNVPKAHIRMAVEPRSLVPTMSREEARSACGVPVDAPVLISIGRLSPEKRPDRLLRVFRRVLAGLPTVHLWIVGDGPLRGDLEGEVKRDDLSGRIRFLGTQDNVASYLQASDLMLLTSDTEGVPGVVLEAGLLGIPTVATRVGGLPECVLDGDTGILVARDDEEALSQAAIGLLRDPSRHRSMGQAAAALVRERFTMETIGADYVSFYHRVLALHRGQ
jgi:glycosyltransferase involved in cell wall biosynthesis